MKNPILFFALMFFVFGSCEHFNTRRIVTSKGESKEIIVNENGDSIMVYYRTDGTIRSKATFKGRYKNGPAYNYYVDGKVQNEIHYNDGYKHGIAKWYYESGRLYRETNYINGQKDGIQKFYYETGELKAEVPYKMGQLQLGTKEYLKSGKLFKDYPEIIVKTIDNMRVKNSYSLQFSLKPPRSKVEFYLVKIVGGKEAKVSLESFTRDGVAEYEYTIYPGYSIMEKVEVRAETKSKHGIPVILRRTYNLAIENRNY
jgi:hypothetical protein